MTLCNHFIQLNTLKSHAFCYQSKTHACIIAYTVFSQPLVNFLKRSFT